MTMNIKVEILRDFKGSNYGFDVTQYVAGQIVLVSNSLAERGEKDGSLKLIADSSAETKPAAKTKETKDIKPAETKAE